MAHNDEYGMVDDGLQDPYGAVGYLEDDTTFLSGGDDMHGMPEDGGLPDDGSGDIYGVGRGGNILDPNKSEAGKMFIGGLNWETTDESMRAYFEKFGEVDDCVVMKDPATSRSRGFGFLTFRDPASVDEVVQLEHTLDGKIIDPKRAIPREEQDKTEKIFVGGVGSDVTEDQFREYFTQFGKVIDATLMIDRETGRPRGFGFITFENSDGVDKAMAKQGMGELAINDKMVEVKRAMPKHKIPQAGATRGAYGRPEAYGGDSRSSNFGPMRSRMAYDMSAMGMRSMGGARGYGYGGMMPYGRYGAGAAGGEGYGGAFGYGMYGRFPGYSGMEGFGGYGRETEMAAAAAAYYARGFGGGGGGGGGSGTGGFGYGYPYGYANMYGGRMGGAGSAGGSGSGGGASNSYRGSRGPESPNGSPTRGSSSRSFGSPGAGRRGYDDEGDSVPLAGGDIDVKPNVAALDSRYARDSRSGDRGDYGSHSGSGSGSGRSTRGSHGYHPYAR